MSYEIIFDKQFIKVKNKFLPFVFGGSSNCTEVTSNNRERTARSWFPLSYNNETLFTEEDLLNSATEYLNNIVANYGDELEELKKDFGSYIGLAIGTKYNSPTFNQYKSMFKTGCRKAIDIETLANHHGYLTIRSRRYAEKKLKEANLEPFSIVVRTEEEFIEVFNEKEKLYGDLIGVDLSLSENEPKRIRKQHFKRVKKQRELVEVVGFWTIVAPNGNYLARYTGTGYKYAHYPRLKYVSESEAKKHLKGRRKNCTLEYINEKANILK